MKYIDIFLTELQKRISVNEAIINDFEMRKNNLIELQNLFYKYDIIANNLTKEDLLSFSSEDVMRIFTIINEKKSDNFYRAFMIYKPLIVSYESLRKRISTDFEAPQYNDAIRWLNDLIKTIIHYLDSSDEDNEAYVMSLKEDNAYYKKYYDLFNSNKLISPIIDLEDFNGLLDKLSLSPEDRYYIKKEVGLAHIRLLAPSKEDESIAPVKDVSLDAEDKEIISEVSEEPAKEEVSEADKEAVSDEIIEKQDDNFITEAEQILKEEHDLINNVSEEDFNAYLAQSISSNDSEGIKYQIVSVLIALHSEIEKYKNAKGFKHSKKIAEDNILEYVEAYKALKEKMVESSGGVK